MIFEEKNCSFISNHSNEKYIGGTDLVAMEPEVGPFVVTDSATITDDIYTLMNFLEQLQTQLSSSAGSDDTFDSTRIIG